MRTIGHVHVDRLVRGRCQARLLWRRGNGQVLTVKRDIEGGKAVRATALPVSAGAVFGSGPWRTAIASNAALGSIAGVTVNETVGAAPCA